MRIGSHVEAPQMHRSLISFITTNWLVNIFYLFIYLFIRHLFIYFTIENEPQGVGGNSIICSLSSQNVSIMYT